MSTTQLRQTVTTHLAAKSDADLVEMMKLSDDRAVTMWIADEICARRPDVVAALDAWELDLESDESLTDVIMRVAA